MRTRMVVIFAVLLLAACATVSTDTPALPTLAETAVADSAPTDPAATPDASQPTAPAGGEGTPTISSIQQAIAMLPPPGTAQVPVTEEPAGQAALAFDNIAYEETGGLGGGSLFIEVFSDGRVVRNGAQTTVSPDVIAELNQMLQDIKFFAIEGQFTMPGAGADVYKYYVRVELPDGTARSLDAQDRVTPPELLRLFSKLRNIGV